ncbi:MAG: YceI family protein [Myxococcota bacterium]
MRTLSTVLLALFVASSLSLVAQSADAASFKGQFKFTSKAPKEDIFGTAKGTADLTIDPNDLTKLKGTITVPVKSMETGNETRDEHMHGSDWLDAGKHPNITFTITSVALDGAVKDSNGVKAAKLKVTGKFTLHGVSKTLTAPATIKWKADGKAKITTKFKIKLADYKVAGKDGVVGSKVGTSIACQVSLVGSVK